MSPRPAAPPAWRSEPPRACDLCERLAAFRSDNRKRLPDYFNAPVPSFGAPDAKLLIVGLAPGLHGANRTGRPFTGDYAGDLLYATLKETGLARGDYAERADDGFTLVGCAVTNAVRCVPPANLPTPAEIANCNRFLTAEIAGMKHLRGILALGGTAHNAVLRAHGLKPARVPFRHGGMHELPDNKLLADSYHVSRLNTNTGRLTEAMFHAVVGALLDRIAQTP